MFDIIINSEYSHLQEEIEKLKIEVSDLIQEKYDLECYIIPALLTTFTETLGSRKRRILAQELMVEEIKYRISMVQAAINREEKIKEKQVDEKVKAEYEEYELKQSEAFQREQAEQQQRYDQQSTRDENQSRYEEKHGNSSFETNTQKESSSDQTSDNSEENQQFGEKQQPETKQSDDSSEYANLSFKQKLKAIYKKLVKKLHPDVNQGFSEKEKLIWNKVQQAYNDGDLETLEKIYDEINEIEVGEIPNTPEGICQLKELLEKLKSQKDQLIIELDKIKNSFPYTEKEFLEDEQKVKELCDKYDKIIAEYEQQIKELTDRYYELLKKKR